MITDGKEAHRMCIFAIVVVVVNTMCVPAGRRVPAAVVQFQLSPQ